MSIHIWFDRTAQFLDRLDRLQDTTHLRDAFIAEIRETGGFYEAPERDTWSSHMFEIGLHGVTTFGADEDDAIRNWIRAAKVQIDNMAAPAPARHMGAA